MRVLCWNVRGATDAKWDHVLELQPDVAVLAEVAQHPRRLQPSLLEPAPAWQWVGVNPAKGLAVSAFGARAATCGVLAPAATGRWSVAARLGSLTVLGIWSCPSAGGTYGTEVVRALDAHARWLDPDAEVIVAGDFNIDGAGALRRRSGAFNKVIDRFGELGLTSAYHTVWHEPFGAESSPTYFHHRNRARPFHIDFCFLSAPLLHRLRAVTVGSYDQWVASGISDHAPLLIELDR
ncbi:MAG: endonuclease/exonuclease/phosphatase family protein [Acidimicrobiales bacterium]